MEKVDWSLMSEEEKISRFNRVLDYYREIPKTLFSVKPIRVVPDTTNRGNTGLSVRHAHFIACRMRDRGFIPRSGNGDAMKGHDLPILIRESSASELGAETLNKWRTQVEKTIGFAPISESLSQDTFFASLGNGHFFAALNLFRTNSKCLWREEHYDARKDDNLERAIMSGVPSVILRADIPRRERRFLSEVLNSAFTYAWNVSENGRIVQITHTSKTSDTKTTQFDALSKSLDSFELEVLIEQHRPGAKKNKKNRSRL
jgi:hypothetical protein